MRARLALVLAIAGAAALAGCGSEPSSPCAQLCEREARCSERRTAEGDRPKFDSGECTAACKALERDLEGKKLVDKHRACVETHPEDCDAVLACP